eukprot:g9455.t1
MAQRALRRLVMDTQAMNGGRFLLVVTGASRGFGRCVAEEFVRQVAPSTPIDLVLVARSERGLRGATDAIDDMAKTIRTADGEADVDVVVRREALDLGDLDQLEAGLEGVFSRIDPFRYSRAMLVNNAGSLGHISFASELPSLATLRSEMDFNVTSAFWVSSRFAAVFGARRSDEKGGASSSGEPASSTGGGAVRDVSNNILVNVSSLAALQPFESWGGYSAGKAARDMFHRVIATEQASIGGLKVLNYAPGPMDTDMAREIRTPEEYEEAVKNGKLIDPRLSAEKCVRLAVRGKFVTGSHVDFFDQEEEQD